MDWSRAKVDQIKKIIFFPPLLVRVMLPLELKKLVLHLSNFVLDVVVCGP